MLVLDTSNLAAANYSETKTSYGATPSTTSPPVKPGLYHYWRTVALEKKVGFEGDCEQHVPDLASTDIAESRYLTWLWQCLDFISGPLPRIGADPEIQKPKCKLGMVLTRHCGSPSAVTVHNVIEGSCAAEAHPKIHDGDTLLAVNGKEVSLTHKMNLEDVKTMKQRASPQGVLKLKLQHGDKSYETEVRLNPDGRGHATVI